MNICWVTTRIKNSTDNIAEIYLYLWIFRFVVLFGIEKSRAKNSDTEQAYKYIYKQNKHTHTHTNTQTNIHTNTHTNTYTNTHTNTHTNLLVTHDVQYVRNKLHYLFWELGFTWHHNFMIKSFPKASSKVTHALLIAPSGAQRRVLCFIILLFVKHSTVRHFFVFQYKPFRYKSSSFYLSNTEALKTCHRQQHRIYSY